MSTKSKKEKVSDMRNEKKGTLPKAFKYYICLLAIAVVVGIIIASIKFFGTEKAQRSASINIEFAYEGAAYSLTPTKDHFSMEEIKENDFISQFLSEAGLSSKYTPEQIISSIEINGLYPHDVISLIKGFNSLYDFSESRTVSINDYYPTAYTIKLYDDFDETISDTDLRNLVQKLAEAYKSYFISEYVYKFDTASFDKILVLDDFDYLQRVKIITLRINEIKKYANEMATLDSSFNSNGMNFNDIILKCNSITNDYITGIEAFIIANSVTISKERLQNQYKYEIKLLENEKKYKETSLNELNALIDAYPTDSILYISSGDSLVKIDSNSKQTYERLIDEKRSISDDLISINTELEKYNMYLNALTNTSGNVTQSNITNSISETDRKVNDVMQTFFAMLKDYNNTIVNEDSILLDTAKYNGAKLLSGSFIIALIKSIGPLFIIVMVICCIHAALSAIKKHKKLLQVVEKA
ncbi:MAG: hypothetical protein K5751_03355 [Treponemataceae bacterium]|nr:hypothetical protein [Treponemataceae bacterium]